MSMRSVRQFHPFWQKPYLSGIQLDPTCETWDRWMYPIAALSLAIRSFSGPVSAAYTAGGWVRSALPNGDWQATRSSLS